MAHYYWFVSKLLFFYTKLFFMCEVIFSFTKLFFCYLEHYVIYHGNSYLVKLVPLHLAKHEGKLILAHSLHSISVQPCPFSIEMNPNDTKLFFTLQNYTFLIRYTSFMLEAIGSTLDPIAQLLSLHLLVVISYFRCKSGPKSIDLSLLCN